MRTTKVAGLVAGVTLALAGCGDGDTGAGPAPGGAGTAPSATRSVDATAQLTAAANRTAAAAYTYQAADPTAAGVLQGAIDPAGPTTTSKLSVEIDPTTKVTVESLFVAGVYYLKIGGLPVPGIDGSTWFKADPAKIGPDNAFALGNAKDPIGLGDMTGSIATVSSTDGMQFAGTFDLTKKAWGPLNDPALVTGLAGKATAVPFTATVDSAGHLAQLKVSVPAYGEEEAAETTVTFAGFGEPVTATAPPAADVKEAPATLYGILNSK